MIPQLRATDTLLSKDEGIGVNKDVLVNIRANLTNWEHWIIELIAGYESITILQLANALNVNEKTICRDITTFKEQGILIRIGADKNGLWKINKI